MKIAFVFKKEVSIDPRVEKLFPHGFLHNELRRHPNVEAVKSGDWLFLDGFLRRGGEYSPACYLMKEKKILIDPTVSGKDLAIRLDVKIRILFSVIPEEAWPFVFCHECKHSDGEDDELRCDLYAKERVLEMRKQKEAALRAREASDQAFRNELQAIFRETFESFRSLYDKRLSHCKSHDGWSPLPEERSIILKP